MAYLTLVDGSMSPQSTTDQSTRAFHSLGARGRSGDGRVYYYAANRVNSAIEAGKLLLGTALESTHINQTQGTSGTGTDAGDNAITLDVGTAAVNLGDYVEGILAVTDSNDEGHRYRISDHTGKAASGGGGQISVVLYDSIASDWSASTKASLVPNLYLDAIDTSTSTSLPVVGVSETAVTAGSANESHTAAATTIYYYWAQTWGPASVLIEDTPNRPVPVKPSENDAGAVAARDALTDRIVGDMMGTGVDGQYHPVFLRITQ